MSNKGIVMRLRRRCWQVDNQMLDFFNKEARESANGLLTPKERFGIVSSKGKHKNAAPYTSTNGGHAIGLDSSTKNSSSKAHRSRKHSRGDPSLPSSMAGEFQVQEIKKFNPLYQIFVLLLLVTSIARFGWLGIYWLSVL